jgi:hypothetical protein
VDASKKSPEGSKLTPEARALAETLLHHLKGVRRARGSEDLNIAACLVTYGDLCERAGVSHLKPEVGRYLREIAKWCHENGWPPVNALAVNYDTRKPGGGYDAAPGCSLVNWLDQVSACVTFEDYPDVVS